MVGYTEYPSNNGGFVIQRPFISVDTGNGCTPIPDNPDVQGFVVRLSLFVSQVLSATLLIISDAYTKTVIGWIILQNYGLLLCAFIFLLLNKLSPNDMDFIITAVHSPIFHYLVVCVILREIKSLEKSKFLLIVVTILLLGVFPLWIVLSGITWLDWSALDHRASITCATRFSTKEYLGKLWIELLWVYSGIGPSSALRLGRALVKTTGTTTAIFTAISLRYLFLIVVPLMMLHKRLRYITISWWLIAWGFTLNVFNIEANYNFQYGQLIAVVPCIAQLYSVGKAIWSRRGDFVRAFAAGIAFAHRFLNVLIILVSPTSRASFFFSLFRNPVVNVEIPLRRLRRGLGSPSQARDIP